MQPISPHIPPHPTGAEALPLARTKEDIQRAAEAFEALFVAEMLSQAGIGKAPENFGGGSGDTAFSSFLTQAYAEKIAASGRFGLAEAIVRATTGESGTDG